MYQPTDFYLKDSTPQASPVAGVVVKVLSPDGKIVYGLQTTDADGHAGFLLPDGQSYQARYYKFGVSTPNPQLFSIMSGSTSNTFDVTAVSIVPPVPNDARLCTAYGFFRDISGAPQAGVIIQFIAKFDPALLDGSAVLKERVEITTNAKGYAQINLIRNGQYNCTVQGEEDVNRTIVVPDAPNVNLPDLIFPVVQNAVITPPGPWTVPVGGTLDLAVEFIGSDGENLGLACGDVIWATSDDNVLNFALNNPTGITLMGVGPGTASIIVVRADQSIVRIPDVGVLINGVITSPAGAITATVQ